MNIFDDLIDELKEDNLLEKGGEKVKKTVGKIGDDNDRNVVENEKLSVDAPKKDLPTVLPDNSQNSPANDVSISKQPAVKSKPVNDNEFFRLRATEEVSGLQMVEHIFSGIERQQKKMVPKPYDDLKVKKALQNFLQVTEAVNSSEHAGAEFELMQETESWYSALSHRDKQISITNLRNYCETVKPVLSSPALISLARFYRNAPYSEAVRSKFDLIVTRLFSKDLTGEKREQTFDRDDLIKHLSELYAEWSSVSLYAGDEESEIVLAAFKFEDFITEAQKAENFDELIKNDFFNRLRSFKQSTGEQFFAPLIAATAVECNIRVGNRYVELLEHERDTGETGKLENKYGFLHDQVISDAASKSLQLVELLKTKVPEREAVTATKKETVGSAEQPKNYSTGTSPFENSNKSPFAVSKWLLVTAAVVILGSFSLYAYFNYNAAEGNLSQDVKKVNIDNSSLKDYVRDARIGNNTFFAVVLPSWETLAPEKKEEILKKIVSIGAAKGFKNVQLLSPKGKSVGVAAGDVVEVRN